MTPITVSPNTVTNDAATQERLYRGLRLIRRMEEVIADIYPSDKIKSPVHLSIGQEAVAVGVCDPLRDSDIVSGTYRSHASYIAKGGDLKGMMAELYGKATGVAGGKAGSMHLIDMAHNILGSSAVVGTTTPIALGYAFALKQRGEDNVVAAFFGDGATEEGVFTESLNFAALKKLPVLFICENNQFAIHQPLHKRWATTRLCERVETYGIPTQRIEDSNVEAVRAATTQALARIRAGEGPSFIECITYRWREHVGPSEDYEEGYRIREDLDAWREKDEMVRLGALIDAGAREKIDAVIEAEIAEAVAFAEDSPFPEKQELYTHVFAN